LPTRVEGRLPTAPTGTFMVNAQVRALQGLEPMSRSEGAALVYLGLPTIVFTAGWIVFPLGPLAGVAVAIAFFALLAPHRHRWMPGIGMLAIPVLAVATLWCLLAGLGHFVYANSDWTVRDAVLVDLVRDPWPVRYFADGHALVLRAPIGYFLPAALVGKLWGIAAAEYALLVWTITGVVLTFALMLRDQPTLRVAVIRIAIFIAFSGMDIVGTIAHYDPHAIGDHLEWWAVLFQYSSQTTQLFWVPNHALPGWLAMAWLAGRDRATLPMTPAILFVVFAPLWSPLTAIGIAPIVGIALVQRAAADPRVLWSLLRDWTMWLPLLVSLLLVDPYLVAGSDQVASGGNADIRWVGEDIVPRTIEFICFEFLGFALLLLWRTPRDVVLWTASLLLVALLTYRFGPFNDLAMRASIPPLTLYAILVGHWLSTPHVLRRDRRSAIVAMVLLAIGAVTPFQEIARVFIEPAWPMNREAAVIDVTRGTHYLTSPDQPWLRRFLRQPAD
jgi:hypothetical protein